MCIYFFPFQMVKELENCKERKLISYDQITVTADLRLSLEINKNSVLDGFRFDEDEEEEVMLQTLFLKDIFKTVTHFLPSFGIAIYFSSFVFLEEKLYLRSGIS